MRISKAQMTVLNAQKLAASTQALARRLKAAHPERFEKFSDTQLFGIIEELAQSAVRLGLRSNADIQALVSINLLQAPDFHHEREFTEAISDPEAPPSARVAHAFCKLDTRFWARVTRADAELYWFDRAGMGR